MAKNPKRTVDLEKLQALADEAKGPIELRVDPDRDITTLVDGAGKATVFAGSNIGAAGPPLEQVEFRWAALPCRSDVTAIPYASARFPPDVTYIIEKAVTLPDKANWSR